MEVNVKLLPLAMLFGPAAEAFKNPDKCLGKVFAAKPELVSNSDIAKVVTHKSQAHSIRTTSCQMRRLGLCPSLEQHPCPTCSSSGGLGSQQYRGGMLCPHWVKGILCKNLLRSTRRTLQMHSRVQSKLVDIVAHFNRICGKSLE